jgi:hypothetical protein
MTKRGSDYTEASLNKGFYVEKNENSVVFRFEKKIVNKYKSAEYLLYAVWAIFLLTLLVAIVSTAPHQAKGYDLHSMLPSFLSWWFWLGVCALTLWKLGWNKTQGYFSITREGFLIDNKIYRHENIRSIDTGFKSIILWYGAESVSFAEGLDQRIISVMYEDLRVLAAEYQYKKPR